MARKPPSIFDRIGASVVAATTVPKKRKTPVAGTMRPRAYIAPAKPPPPPPRKIVSKPAPVIGLDKLGPPSRDKQGRERRIGGGSMFSNREILALDTLVRQPKKEQVKVLGKAGQKELAKYAKARDAEKRARREAIHAQFEDRGLAGSLMDLFPGSRLWGAKPGGVSLAAGALNVPLAGQVIGGEALSDLQRYFEESRRRQKKKGLKGSAQAAGVSAEALSDIGETLSKVALGVPAGIYGAVTSPRTASRDTANLANSLVQLPGMLYAAVDPRAPQGARRARAKEAYEGSLDYFLGQYGPGVSYGESFAASKKTPVTSALTGLPALTVPARGVSIAKGLAAGLSPRDAHAASARPYLRGPQGERILRLRGGPGGRAIDVPAEYVRSPLFRPLQRGYDAVSRAVPFGTPIIAESKRAARVQRRGRQRGLRREIAQAQAIYQDIADLTGEEQKRLIFTREKPPGVPDEVWLGSMLEDIQEMIAGRDIITPDQPDPPSLQRARRRVAYLERRFQTAVERRGATILGEMMAPLVSKSRSLREQIRYRRRQGEDTSVLEQELYDVNARLELAQGKEGVRPVRDSPEREQFARVLSEQLGTEKVGPLMAVTDALARAAEPENPTKWYRTRLSESSIGTAEEMTRLVAQGTGLWQRPGYSYNLVRRDAPPEPGDLVYVAVGEDGVGGEAYLFRALDEDGDFQVDYLGGGHAGVVKASEVDRVVNLPHGRNVVTRDGFHGTISDVPIESESPGTVTITTADGGKQEVWLETLAPEHAPIFYSHAQRVIEEKGQPKATPQQWQKLLEKEGVKADEMEWSGLNDWLEGWKDVKSIAKDDFLRFFANPHNAFDLSEVLFTGEDSRFPTRWGNSRGPGLVFRDYDEDYRELVMTLPGPSVFTHGHWSSVTNPLLHIRFHEIDEGDGRKLVIDELQSDWHQRIQDVGVRPKNADALIQELRVEATRIAVKQQELAMKFGLDTTADQAHRDLYRLMSQMMSDIQEYVVDHRETTIAQASEAAGLTELTKAYRLSERLEQRKRRMRDEEVSLIGGAPGAPFQKNRWLDLAMKRLIAYAAREGFDRIEWVEGHVQAVRYELFHGGVPGSGEQYEYETPEDHPSYPDQDDYTHEYTYAKYDLATIPEPDGTHLQERLFGQSIDVPIPGAEATWQQGVKPVSMRESQPLRIALDDIDDADEFTGNLDVGGYITPMTGDYANVLMRVIGRDGDDILVAPTGVSKVEVSGNKRWGDQEIEVSLYDESGNHMLSDYIDGGGNYYLAEMLDQSGEELIVALNAQHWFDELDVKYDKGWEPELDQDGWDEAVSHWQSEYGDEVGEGGGGASFDEIHSMGDYDLTDSGRGVVRFYDEVLPNSVRKLLKADKVEVSSGTVRGRYSSENSGELTEYGYMTTYGFDVTPGLKEKALSGQRLFQAAHHGKIKGAVEFLGGDRMAMRLFESADVSTVLHELGHIALYDMSPEDVAIIDRDIASGRSFLDGEWTEDDHERYARAWEKYFLDGKASSTSLRGVYDKLMAWMRLVYAQAIGMGVRVSPEVQGAFNRRLGRVEVSESDIVRYAGAFDKEVSHWGAVLSQAKTEMQSLETRLNAMRDKGTDAILKDERGRLEEQRKETTTEEGFQELSERIDAIDDELEQLEVERVSRSDRREKLLAYQMAGLESALKNPKDEVRYAAAVNAANYLQRDREAMLREILGDSYDEVFAGRRAQTSQWLAARGVLDPADVGEGEGFMPFTRGPEVRRSVQTGTRPGSMKYGKQSTRELNLHKRNEMMLWQLGDFRADPKILMESWARAATFKWQADLRSMLYDIGEDVGRGGPKKGWYLIDPEGKPLPKHWKTGLSDEEIAKVLNDLEGGDDEGLATRLNLFAKNWLSREPTDFVAEDGTYPGIRQVHPSVVHSLVMPYMPRSAVQGGINALEVANSMARLSLIYANPGYIPSNVFANSVLGLANSPWFVKDASVAIKWMVEDKKLARAVMAEMGDASLSSMLPERGASAIVQRSEKWVAEREQIAADNWARVAGWIGTARRNGYTGKKDLIRLLESKDPKVMRDKDFISREATNAMIDFDRLSPFEKRYLQPVLFVWPFLRGAMAWPVSYVLNFPERAAVAAAVTAGIGEEQREKLGPVPPYYEALVPGEVEPGEGVGWVSNLQSISPLGPFSDAVKVAFGVGAGAVEDEKMSAFYNLFGYIAPQYQAFILAAQGRNEFGGEAGLRTIASKNMTDLIPGWPILGDVLDETKPAIYMEQDLWDTLYRRTFRFSPQQVNINVLNERAENRKVETPGMKTTKLIKKARASWSRANPTEPLPRSVEQSIRAFYAHSEAIDLKQEAIKKSGSWRPKRGERTPKLTPIQATTVAFDILNAYFPGVVEDNALPDPEKVLREQGEDAVEDYGRIIRRNMFRLKEKAQDAIREEKERKEAAA